MNTIILFVVLTVLIFVVAYYWDKKYRKITDIRTYQDIEKLAEFDGDFEYRDEGFYVKLKESRRFIRWDGIINVISKKYSVAGESKMVYEIKTLNEPFEIDWKNQVFINLRLNLTRIYTSAIIGRMSFQKIVKMILYLKELVD